MKRCRALYDCEADNDDELSFEEGNIILILNEETEDENWMEGMLESQPSKRGLFPVSFVHILDWTNHCNTITHVLRFSHWFQLPRLRDGLFPGLHFHPHDQV